MVIDLDITSPLRTLKNIEALVDKKLNSDADLVFSVTDSRRNPYFNMVMKTEKGYERVIKSYYNARQEAPEIFDMNASMYAYLLSFLQVERNI
jgi:CMP-N,N'-diacetyllegionaminic acid synthase